MVMAFILNEPETNAMTGNAEERLQALLRGGKNRFLFFWGHRERSGGVTSACLSQWYGAPFVVEARRYPTAEHWMMAQKALLFADHAIHARILQAKSPSEAKSLGREVRHFDEATWKKHCYDIVVCGNFHKFSQHPDLRKFLQDTGNRVLVEASPVDRVWGIGLAAGDERARNPRRWRGQNLLGFALMDVRERIGKEAPDKIG
jgi:ribA/ribD-fused uncharacterized protein